MPRVTDFAADSKELSDMLQEQNETYRFKTFSPDLAFELGLLIRETFLKGYFVDHPDSGIIIGIRTVTDHWLFAGTAGNPSKPGPGNWDWAARKEKMVRKTGKSSYSFGRWLVQAGITADKLGLPFPEYAAAGGGFPVHVQSSLSGPVAVILVSGLPEAEDHQLIIDALDKFLPTLEGKQ